MRKIFSVAGLAAALVLTALPALAGEGKGCSYPTQECLDGLAKNLASRGWVGVELERQENGTMKVRRVVEESPAEAAGLQVGDVLLAAQGLEYGKATEEEWGALMGNWGPGQAVSYRIERDGDTRMIDLKLGEMPPRVRAAILGAHMIEHAKVAQAVN